MKTNLTSGEYRILDLIVNSEYHSERPVVDDPVWQVTETKEDRGFLTSCVKKGYAAVDNSIPKEATCWITAEGYEVYKNYSNDKS